MSVGGRYRVRHTGAQQESRRWGHTRTLQKFQSLEETGVISSQSTEADDGVGLYKEYRKQGHGNRRRNVPVSV